jgi:plastocyanin
MRCVPHHSKELEMRKTATLLAVALMPLGLTFCSSDNTTGISTTPSVVQMLDECDPTSFNAVLGADACTRQGTITLTQFNAELASQQTVPEWRFDPASFTIRVGQSINAMNVGGETHTFTEVESFGGGMVPSLNSASGNTVEAPECADLATNALVKPGASFTTDAATEVGVEHYQCCIHPWMRATVTVTN